MARTGKGSVRDGQAEAPYQTAERGVKMKEE
jgi:hypothetical protein